MPFAPPLRDSADSPLMLSGRGQGTLTLNTPHPPDLELHILANQQFCSLSALANTLLLCSLLRLSGSKIPPLTFLQGMPDLPHGWRMRNSGGELVGPPLEKDDVGSDGSEGSEASEQLNIQPDSDGWEDLEDDTEAVSIKCLLCTDVFPAARPMLEHTKEDHSLDFLAVRAERGSPSRIPFKSTSSVPFQHIPKSMPA